MGDYDTNPNYEYLKQTVEHMLARVQKPVKRSEAPVLDIIFGRCPDTTAACHILLAANNGAELPKQDVGTPQPYTVVPLPYSDPKIRSLMYKTVNNHNHETLDLGSGDFKKGMEGFILGGKYRGPPRLLFDINKPEGFPVYDELEDGVKTQDKYSIVFKSFDFMAPDNEFLHSYMKSKPNVLLTSTNALMHSADLSHFRQYDMIYTLPMPSVLHQQGTVSRYEEGQYVFVGAPGKVEYEHSEQLDNVAGDLQGLAINLARREVEVEELEMTEYHLKQHLTMALDRKPLRVSNTVKGTLRPPYYKKLDGITMVIKRTARRMYVKTPVSFNVYTVKGPDNGPLTDFEIEGEYIQKAGVMVLHAVHRLGSIRVPTFMKKIEAEFVDKYKIKGLPFQIYSKKAYETVDSCLTSEEVFGEYKVVKAEGVVCNSHNNRSRVMAKVFETMEMTLPAAERLVDEVYVTYGIKMQLFPKSEALTEYLFYKDGEEIVLKADKIREDKVQSNDMGRCMNMVMNMLEGTKHALTDYMDPTTLALYGIVTQDTTVE